MITISMDNARAYNKPYLVVSVLVVGMLLLRTFACSIPTVVNPRLEMTEQLQATTSELLATDPDLSLFANALKVTNLFQTIDEKSSVLVFAPTNIGIREQGATFFFERDSRKDENEARLIFLLNAHIVENTRLPIKFTQHGHTSMTLKTLTGYQVSVRLIGAEIIVGHDAFAHKMVKTSNGFVLYIDKLLLASLA